MKNIKEIVINDTIRFLICITIKLKKKIKIIEKLKLEIKTINYLI